VWTFGRMGAQHFVEHWLRPSLGDIRTDATKSQVGRVWWLGMKRKYLAPHHSHRILDATRSLKVRMPVSLFGSAGAWTQGLLLSHFASPIFVKGLSRQGRADYLSGLASCLWAAI
jgi:hypothetical protein